MDLETGKNAAATTKNDGPPREQTTDLCLEPASSVSIAVRTGSGCSQRCWGELLRRRENGGGRGSATYYYVPSRTNTAAHLPVPFLAQQGQPSALSLGYYRRVRFVMLRVPLYSANSRAHGVASTVGRSNGDVQLFWFNGQVNTVGGGRGRGRCRCCSFRS
jgi:hypothetical protein